MKRTIGFISVLVATTLCFSVLATQEKSIDDSNISIECGLAIYHAFQAYDESLGQSDSSVVEYAPLHLNRVSCVHEWGELLIVKLWNDPPVLGGTVAYKLSKSDYSVLEAVAER